MPRVPDDASRVEMDATTLATLLDGIDVRRGARPAVYMIDTSRRT